MHQRSKEQASGRKHLTPIAKPRRALPSGPDPCVHLQPRTSSSPRLSKPPNVAPSSSSTQATGPLLPEPSSGLAQTLALQAADLMHVEHDCRDALACYAVNIACSARVRVAPYTTPAWSAIRHPEAALGTPRRLLLAVCTGETVAGTSWEENVLQMLLLAYGKVGFIQY
ncbi:hypothetical protein EJB05_11223, partial [Eragrostis curvula]